MSAQLSDPRSISVDAPPVFITDDDQLRYMLGLAALAPSTFNTQPWTFDVAGDCIGIIPDLSRQLRVIDPEGRELVISCGAALANLVVAARFFGIEVEVEGNGHRLLGPHHVARMRMVRSGPPRDQDGLLFHAIPRRHTVRQPFHQRGVSDLQMRRIMHATESEGVTSCMVDEPELRTRLSELARTNLIDLSRQTERSQEANRWRLPRESRRLDGVPQAALGMSMKEFLWHYLSGGMAGVTKKAGKALQQKTAKFSRILVLSTANDSIHDWLEAGYAMERALLRAAAIGIQASFMGALTHSPEAREKTRVALQSTRIPQLFLCLGYSNTQPVTPRRPVEHMTRVS